MQASNPTSQSSSRGAEKMDREVSLTIQLSKNGKLLVLWETLSQETRWRLTEANNNTHVGSSHRY